MFKDFGQNQWIEIVPKGVNWPIYFGFCFSSITLFVYSHEIFIRLPGNGFSICAVVFTGAIGATNKSLSATLALCDIVLKKRINYVDCIRIEEKEDNLCSTTRDGHLCASQCFYVFLVFFFVPTKKGIKLMQFQNLLR